jgi:hypothetical protein
VLIADHGCRIRPHPSRVGFGLGFTLIASLCDELQIVKRSSGGTGLWLWFKLKTEVSRLVSHPRGSMASATALATLPLSTTTQPEPESTSVSSPGTS